MNNFHKKTTLLFLGLFTSLLTIAQPNHTSTVEMADTLYQSGKIYVVVGVLLIIFIGIVIYLIMLDKKISKIEHGLKNK